LRFNHLHVEFYRAIPCAGTISVVCSGATARTFFPIRGLPAQGRLRTYTGEQIGSFIRKTFAADGDLSRERRDTAGQERPCRGSTAGFPRTRLFFEPYRA